VKIERRGMLSMRMLLAVSSAATALFFAGPLGGVGPAAVYAAAPKIVWDACGNGSSAGQCIIPRGVAGDPESGHVFVADQQNRRVVELTAWGEFLRAWGWDVVSSGPDDDTSPPEDQFEICIPRNGDICKAGISGSGAGEFGALAGPQGVALDSAGNVYVVDRDSRRVQKFDAEGHFMLMFGGDVNKTKVEGAGSEAARNLCPVDPGDVCQAGSEGVGKGQFGAWAVGSFISIDKKHTTSAADDSIYVGDQNRLQIFDAAGHYTKDLPDPDGALAGRVVQSLAVDEASGNLDLAFSGQPNVLQVQPGGKSICVMEVERPSAISADAHGRVWVVSAHQDGTPAIPMKIVQFSSASCLKDELHSFNAEDEGFKVSTGLATATCVGSAEPGDLYVTNSSSAKSFVRAYGTPPVGCEPPPNKPPEITEQYAIVAGSDSATVRAAINPHFLADTTLYVEYGPGDCSSGSCNRRSPVAEEIQLGGGVTQDVVTSQGVLLTGLEPATTYHYRFVAKSGGGGPEFGQRPQGEVGSEGEATFGAGLDAVFTTPPLPAPPRRNCVNQAFRTGAASFLPDCRSFEMVSPVNKNGGGIEALTAIANGESALKAELDQSSGGGDRFTFSSKQGFGDAIGAPYSSQYVASRDSETGWSVHAINAPAQNFPGGADNTGLDTEYKAFSDDLSEAWMIHQAEPPLAPCAPAGSADLYRRDNKNDSYEALHCKPNLPLLRATGTIELLGVSGDGCRAIFRANSKLTETAVATGPYQLYESSCDAPVHPEGQIELVSVLPGGEPCKENSQAGSSLPPVGENDGRSRNLWHAFSTDAHRLYWSCGKTLYLRVDPDLAVEGDEKTIKVAGPAGLGSIEPRFQGASPDGGLALLNTYNAATNVYQLQEYDANGEPPSRMTIAEGIEGPTGERLNLMGASEDATRVYFVSQEALTATPNSEGDKAVKGLPNLYLHEKGGEFSFVGSLSGNNLEEGLLPAEEGLTTISPVNEYPFRRASRVSADGLHAAFISSARLTGFDNTDASSGKADAEVFVYDASANGGAGEVICVSCNPTGIRPGGDRVGAGKRWTAAYIPGWPAQLYPGHPLSESGRRLFFNSFEPLVNRDTNNREDVYEWQEVDGEGKAGKEECDTLGTELYVQRGNGCISLISSGQDPQASEFVDADRDGSDVFIRTGESLLNQDPGLVDIYDARIRGGVPAQAPLAAGCEGDACQNPPSPPAFLSPASSSYSGPANPTPSLRHPCPRSKRNSRRGSGRHCVARKHRHKGQHHRRAKLEPGGGAR
jgi:NHL repeat-containing protein